MSGAKKIDEDESFLAQIQKDPEMLKKLETLLKQNGEKASKSGGANSRASKGSKKARRGGNVRK